MLKNRIKSFEEKIESTFQVTNWKFLSIWDHEQNEDVEELDLLLQPKRYFVGKDREYVPIVFGIGQDFDRVNGSI